MGDYGGRGYGGRGRAGGFKRRREEEQPLDPIRVLLANLMRAGDDAMPSLKMDDEAVNALVKNVKKEARANPAAVRSMLINCAVQLPAKVPLYALTIGLINVDEPAFAAELLTQASSELDAALQDPSSYRKARLLLRLMAALVVPGVTQPASVVAALRALVDAAAAAASTSTDQDGRTWQPYGDHLVYMALAALPFGGPELAEGAGDALGELLSAAEAYLAARPRAQQPGLRPFAAAIKEDDPLAECDCGGASFLPELVAAVREAADTNGWVLQGVARLHMGLEATLANAPQTHAVAAPAVPASPPVQAPAGASDTLVGALVLRAFPPRGTIRFLEPQHTLGDRRPLERLVAEDYVTDSVAWFEGDRVESAKQLARCLPLPYPFEPLLCEVLFGQLLRLPGPEFKPIMYSTLMVELCKLLKTFPRAMSACVRESFARMNVMDPALRERLAEWLAYHLSNFEYVWPWAKWAHVLEAPPYDGQRRFCVAVMNRMVRLSYWERVQAVVPEEFRGLLPPAPAPAALPATDDTEDPEGAAAAEALALVRGKASAEELEAWVVKSGLEARLGGKVGVLRCLARCLLVAGAKSYTHMIIALERYYGPLALLAKDTGDEGQRAMVSAAAQTWAANPQRAVMAVDRLMTLRLVSAEAIVGWVFGPDGVRRIADQSCSGMAWEMLRRAVHKTIARVEDATEDLDKVRKAAAGGDEGAAAAVPEKEAYLAETTAQQQAAVMQVLKSFAEALSEGGFAYEGGEEGGLMDADASEGVVLRDYMVASMRSFLREYHVQAAELEARVQEEVASKASEEVAALLAEQLKM